MAGVEGTRVCLPPSHVMRGGAPLTLRVDGVVVVSVVDGRMLCTVNDLGPGKHLITR
jgi:hypothetical protein